ncbi:flavodoxin domain-containing protein [Actinomadura sp. GC306]|uniref:flavodoxin domain-containing protein n=1 Tax=Actinomadura sp. GC306 TaxID=2530367 RepID=UPI0014051A3D|nr:flavodoxin domain-containing protein [Actinomadura sp. GC306]
MAILVGYASAHGSTRGIAQRIGAVLAGRGFAVDVRPVDAVRDLAGHEAVVLGSAVHDQAWLPEARGLLLRERAALSRRPVWLFSVGAPPAAHGPWPGTGPNENALLTEGLQRRIGVRDHRRFAGVLLRQHMPLAARLRRRLLGVRYGDHRDWPRIDTWASSIADDLEAGGSVPRPRRADRVVVPLRVPGPPRGRSSALL